VTSRQYFAVLAGLCGTIELAIGLSRAHVRHLRERIMRKNALLTLLLSSAVWIGGCSLMRVAGPPCVGTSCPTGAGGQLPSTANTANAQSAPPANTEANKTTDAPSQHRSLASRLHLTHGS
jgi:hypothetical protein